MADALNDPLERLIEDNDIVTGAAFTDMDGEDIAVMPRDDRETLRLCAAYNGIAFRRLSNAGEADGHKRVHQIVARGAGGAVISRRIGDDYQLVVRVKSEGLVGGVLPAVRAAARALEAAI